MKDLSILIQRLKQCLVFMVTLFILFGIFAVGVLAHPAPHSSLVFRSDNTSALRFAPDTRSVIIDNAVTTPVTVTVIRLALTGTYKSGSINQEAAVSVDYDPGSKRLFVVNEANAQIDVLNINDPTNPTLHTSINVAPYGATPSTVAVYSSTNTVAVAVINATSTASGTVAFFNTNGTFLNSVTVGSQPDTLTFTPDGQKVLVTNEGTPDPCNLTDDPEGSVSIIDISGGVGSATVSTAGFTAFNGSLPAGVRIKSGVSNDHDHDLEPEGITISADSKTAWVSLQENNAMGILDIDTGVISDVVWLGLKDHSKSGRGLDASDKDGKINITTWDNVKGMYQPDQIAAYQSGGNSYIVSANEGASRSIICPNTGSEVYTDVIRVTNLSLDSSPGNFPNPPVWQQNSNLGRLKVSRVDGDVDSDGQFEELHAFGARSFSIWDVAGGLIYDSGDAFERNTASRLPLYFNSGDDQNNSFDQRSDNKGPEPQTITTGAVGEHSYAFIGLEQMGGVMVYKITNPNSPAFIDYVNTRDFRGDVAAGTAGDLSPTDMVFIPGGDSPSPSGKPLLIVANSSSGTTAIFEITELKLVLDEFVFLPIIKK